MANSAITGPVLSDVKRSPAGTAAAPSWSFADSTGTGAYLVSPDVFGVSTAGLQRMVVDASGNVGIGTGSPTVKLDVQGGAGTSTALVKLANISSASVSNIVQQQFFAGNTFGGLEQIAAITATNPNASANNGGTLIFSTSANGTATTPTERMRIDASGNALHNTATAPSILSSTPVLTLKHSATAAIWGVGPTSNFGNFYVSTGTGGVFLAEGGTAWQAVSDERMKKNIQPLELGLEQIKALKPTRFDYIDEESENSSRVGFIAQEVLSVLPHAVHSPDDAEQMMGVSATEMIPVLVKAIQEQQAIITALTARVAALESN